MRRTLTLILAALLLTSSMSISAFAAEETDPTTDTTTETTAPETDSLETSAPKTSVPDSVLKAHTEAAYILKAAVKTIVSGD